MNVSNCISCISPTLVFNGSCYSECPNDFLSNETNCYPDPALQKLNSSLSSTNLIPMPFTITTGGIIFITVILKFRY